MKSKLRSRPAGAVLEALESRQMLSAATGIIRGVAFHDYDANHFDESEGGLAGLRVYIDSNRNGHCDAGEPQVRTDTNGKFTFAPLPANVKYRVILVQPDKTLSPTTYGKADVFLQAGQIKGLRFGFAETNTVCGSVYKDLNADGRQTASENNCAGMTVYLDNNNDGQLDNKEPSATTNSLGLFSLKVLGDGWRRINVIAPTGWRISDLLPYVFPSMNEVHAIGITQWGGIELNTFHDLDEDGKVDNGEEINNFLFNYVFCYLDLNHDLTNEENEPNSEDDDFASRLNALKPGTYHLDFALDPGISITNGNFDNPLVVRPGELLVYNIGLTQDF